MDRLANPSAAIIDGLRAIIDGYDAILCDVWGVVHDGERANQGACEALAAARRRGLPVVLITNAPRPAAAVMDQMAAYGVDRECYDAVVSSGDVTVALMLDHGNAPFYFMGPHADLLRLEEGWQKAVPLPPRVGIEEAAYVVCAGLVDDETERPEDYDAILGAMRARDLTMICANPDLVVYRGERLTPCAGALAVRYEEQGGKAVYAGKPHAPIYTLAVAKVEGIRGQAVSLKRVLAIGDAMRTDVAGGVAFGLDVLFVTNGIHRGVLHDDAGTLDHARYDQFLGSTNARPRAAMSELVW